MFDLRQLRYFIAVAKHENVGRAAEELNLTQSPLSRQIIELEARLGLSLFHRSKKRLKLTVTGRDLLEDAKALLAQADRLSRKAEGIASGKTGSLSIGYVDGAIHARLLSPQGSTQSTGMDSFSLNLRPMRSHEQFEKLSMGEIDIGLAHAPHPDISEFVSRKIHVERFVIAAPARFGWKSRVKSHQLDGQRFIWLPAEEYPQAKLQFIQDCRAAGFEPDISLEARSPLTALDLASAGLGLAVVQASFAARIFESITFVELPASFNRNVEIYLIHRLNPVSQIEKFVHALQGTKE